MKDTFAVLAAAAFCAFAGVHTRAEGAGKIMRNDARCEYWRAHVEAPAPPPGGAGDAQAGPSITLSEEPPGLGEVDTGQALEGIGCLLKLKGKTSPSKFLNATLDPLRYGEARLPRPTVEVAALFYASALYYGRWGHAPAIVLVDQRGRKNTKASIDKAYRAYRAWFGRVKAIGLEKARQQHLDPLAGTGVRWY